MSITYNNSCKYQLKEEHVAKTGIKGWDIDQPYMRLLPSGLLYIDEGYAWDGPSGPTFDTKSFMRGSLVHDALYQLMREEQLPRTLRDLADRLLRKHCIEDGMWRIRAWWVYQALRLFGAKNTLPSQRRPLLRAP